MSEIRLSKSAYFHNLEAITNKVGSKDRIFIILKDDAYAHGIEEMSVLAKEFGIKTAVVRNESEALKIKDNFEKIIILSHIADGSEKENFIYAINHINALNIIKSGSKVHLAIDTLMHRNGLNLEEINEAFKLAKARNIQIQGAYTHFRSSDEKSAEFFVQKENFKEAKEIFKNLAKEFGIENFIFHSHNSAATERESDFEDEAVRVGIAQFGYAQFDESLNLKRVLSLHAHKISQRVLKKGQSIGYGGTYEAKEDLKVATYDLGYGDGLFRYAGVGELKLANGKNILGKMSMDSFSCEDSGDEICVFDDARVWSKFFGTIEYDVLVKLKPWIRKKIID